MEPLLTGATVEIVSGCQPSDTLALTPLPSAPLLYARSACLLNVSGSAAASTYSNLLATTLLQTNFSNVAPLALTRVIRVRLLGAGLGSSAFVLATSFTSVAVQPVNVQASAANTARSLFLPEGALPDFAVVIRAPGSCTATVHGLPALCLEDPNPPFYRSTDASDAYAGSRSSPLAVQPASTYQLSFPSPPTLALPYPCALSARIVPVGPALWDCSAAAKSDAASSGEACYFQRFRLAATGSGANASLSCPSCIFDFEALHCDAAPATPLPLPSQLSFNVTLSVNDTLRDAQQLPAQPLLHNFTLHIADAPEATAIIAPDPSLLALLAAPAPASPLQPLELDDGTGLPIVNATSFILCCQDSAVLLQQLLRFHPQALEGAAALPPGANASAFFAAAPLGPPQRLDQTSAAACFAALAALPPSHFPATASAPSARLSLVYAQAFTLQAAAVGVLARVPARSLTLRLWAAPGAQSDGVFYLQRVLLSRKNFPMAWSTSGVAAASASADARLELSAAPGAAPGSALAYLNVSDADADQGITFTLLNASVACVGTPAQPALPGLLALAPVPGASRTVVDAATGAARALALARSAAIVVGRDALAGCGGAAFTVTMAVRAQDSGDFSASHSLLPPRPPTATPVLSVAIAVAAWPGAVVSSAVGPAGGLSASGGDFVDFYGDNLGLPGGNATSEGVPPLSSAVFFTPSTPAASFPLLNCTVAARLVQVRCVTSAGWSPSASLPLTLSATILGTAYSWPTGLFYAPVAPLAVGGSSSAGLPGLASSLALLQASPSFTAAALSASGSAAVQQQLPSPALGWYQPLSPALAHLQQRLSEDTFPLLVGNAPPCSALEQASSCVALSAILSSESAGVLPLGRCAQRCPAATAAASPPPSGSFLGNASTAAALASAAIFDCPMPNISGGAWLSVGISARVLQPRSASGCALFAEPPVLYAAGAPLPDPAYEAALQALAASSAGAFTGAAALPSITAISRVSNSSTRFALTGRNLGTGPKAGDVVEYFAAPPCPASGVTSCAVLRGRGCVYTSVGTEIECELDPGGWGSGFSVRVTVGGRTSPAVTDARGALAYPKPQSSALTLRLGVPLGAQQQNASSSPLLAPSGGSLVSVSGPGLWPPSALNITIGGVPVLAVNLRDLAAQEASGGGAPAASCASLAAAAQSPLLPATFAACFGDPLLPYPLPFSQFSPPALLLSAPPGFGAVALEVCLGPSTEACATADIEYAPPAFTAITLLRKVDTASAPQYKLALGGTGLPPCVLSLPTQSGPTLVNISQFALGSTLQSPYAANQSALPENGTGEGSLPRPLSPAPSLQACALPSSCWVRASLGASGAWSRSVTSLPSAALNLSTSNTTLSTSTGDLGLSSALYSPASQADFLQLTTSEERGTFILAVSAGANFSASAQIAYDIDRLSTPTLTIGSVDLTTWSAGGGQNVTITLSNTNKFGAVLLYPEGAYSAGNATPSQCANAAGGGAPWPTNQHIICPMLPSTDVTIFDQQDNPTARTAEAWLAEKKPPDAGGFAYLASDFLSWQLSPVKPPCHIVSWQGIDGGFTKSGLRIQLSTPAWAGSLSMVVTSNIGKPTAPYTVEYTAPAVERVDPPTGPTNGSVVTIFGANFGPMATLGMLWNARAEVLWRQAGAGAATAISPLAGASYVYFDYDAVEPFLRLCRVLTWSDSAITCLTPEGVSGSPNSVRVVHSVPASASAANATSCSAQPSAWRLVESQSAARFQYSEVVLFPSPGPSVSFNSRQVVTLYGASLSRFNLPPPGSQESFAAALVQSGLNASLAAPQPPDASASLNASLPWTAQAFWRPAVVAKADRGTGLVDGRDELSLPVADILLLTHNSVTFYKPVIEGTVEFFLQFANANGDLFPPVRTRGAGVTLQAPQPNLTSLAAVPAASLGEGVDDADPCTSVALATTLGARLPNSTAACLAAAVQPASQPLPPAPNPRAPCFRADSSAAGVAVQLELQGANFGSGAALTSIVLLPGPGNAFNATPCVAVSGSSVLVNNATLRCAVATPIPRGPVVVQAQVAYFTLASNAPAAAAAGATLNLTAACPCGMYSERDGALCAPCPPGGSCIGGLDKPRALPGFAETIAAQWAIERGIDVALYRVPRFVGCPTPSACLRDQLCAVGAEGWMCSFCKDLYARGYDGVCAPCSRQASLGLVAGVALGGLLLLGLSWRLDLRALLEERYLRHLRVYFQPAAQRQQELLVAAAGRLAERDKEHPVVPLGVLLKQALGFFQVFGALAGFVSGNRIRRVFAEDQKLVPNVLGQLEFMADLGLNAAVFKCFWPLGSNNKVLLIMFLPLLVLGAWLAAELAMALARCYAARSSRPVASSTAAADAAGAAPAPADPAAPAPPPPPPPPKVDLVYLMLLAEFVVVPMAVSGLARAQDCAAVAVGGYLLDDPRTSCYDPAFMRYQTLGFGMAWVYIGLLLAVVQLLRGNCDCSSSCRPSTLKDTTLRFLTEGFKDGFTERTWEAVTMIRKALLLGLPTGLVGFRDGRTQITAVLMLLSAAISAAITFKPYQEQLINDLDLLGLFASLAVAFSVSTRVSAAMSAGYGIQPVEQFVFDAVALLLCAPFCLMWVFLLADSALFDGYMGLALRLRVRRGAEAATARLLAALAWCCPCCSACCPRPAAQAPGAPAPAPVPAPVLVLGGGGSAATASASGAAKGSSTGSFPTAGATDRLSFPPSHRGPG